MNFRRRSNEVLLLEKIPEPVAEILRGIPGWHAGSSSGAEERIFPSPGQTSDGLLEDWKAHVQPGLHEHFTSARETVLADLRGMKETRSGRFQLEIPLRHAEAWVNAITQARLAMAETHEFSEEELSRPFMRIPRDAREFARVEMDVMAAIQEWLVGALDEEDS